MKADYERQTAGLADVPTRLNVERVKLVFSVFSFLPPCRK